ncbi:3099_t:CDS:1, partial [Acaulospora colombiana]
LEYVLKQAGDTPLKLHILGPLQDGMMELLASSGHPIQDMTVAFASGPPSIGTGILSGFNTGPLRQLYITAVNSEPEDVKKFLDMALRSTQKDLHLGIFLEEDQKS